MTVVCAFSTIQVEESLPKNPKEEEEIVDEDDFQESQIEAERPKLTWPQMIDEALQQSDDKRLHVGEVWSYISRHYPYFTRSADRWEKARRVIRDSFPRYGYKKVKANEDEGHLWALRDYEGPDIIHEGATKSKFSFCKKCCNPMKQSNLARHESLCGRDHLVMLGKVCFCRRCGDTFMASEVEQHDTKCFVEDKDVASNLQLHNVRRIQGLK